MKFKKEVLTFVRFSASGVSTTALFALMVWFFSRLGWSYPLYTAVVYTITIIFNFLMHSLFTFKMTPSKILRGGVVFRFLVVTLTLTGLVQLIQWLVIDRFGVPELVGVAAGMLFYVSCSFLLHRFWVFRGVDVIKSSSGKREE